MVGYTVNSIWSEVVARSCEIAKKSHGDCLNASQIAVSPGDCGQNS